MRKTLLLGILVLCMSVGRTQGVDSLAGKALSFPGRLLGRIQRKVSGINDELTSQTAKYLQKMASREAAMQKKLSRIDSASAKTLFAGSAQRYAALERQMRSDTGTRSRSFSGVYPAYLDSMRGSVMYLQQNPQLMSGGAAATAQLQGAGSQIQALQAKMGDADQVQAFLQQRKQVINQYLAGHSSVQSLLGKPMAGMNQDVYYYSQQIRAYKEMWTSPDALEQKALALMNRLPAFQTFMQGNSMLGGLFHLPGGYGGSQAISGLQTKTQVAQLVQGQVSAGGEAGATNMQSNLETAQSKLDGYKSKLGQLGGGNGDLDMPDFKPNDQKTKTFWKRLEYGVDFQTTHTNYYFPMVTDFGASLGYKLGHNNLIGVGASYKLGWGNGIQDIAFSSQGVGLRSFVQIHVKGTFSATGGFEYNYTTPFASFQNLKLLQYWTKSGLIGVTKTVSLKNRVFKKTSVSLLWDFLSYQQSPPTQPFLFRIGYAF